MSHNVGAVRMSDAVSRGERSRDDRETMRQLEDPPRSAAAAVESNTFSSAAEAQLPIALHSACLHRLSCVVRDLSVRGTPHHICADAVGAPLASAGGRVNIADDTLPPAPANQSIAAQHGNWHLDVRRLTNYNYVIVSTPNTSL